MKLLHKILLGYFLVVSVLGVFSTSILIYNINKQSQNIDTYREREITSLAKIIDAVISNKEDLKNLDKIQALFLSTTQKLPHIKRLTLHAQDGETLQYTHIASSIHAIIGVTSHEEDINAILNNHSTILYETNEKGDRYLDITYPILDMHQKPIAALGIAVSLKESDKILQKSIEKMKEDALNIISIAVSLSIILALILAFIISKIIIAPLSKLKNAVASISNHELKHEILISSNDEIGELSKEFNKMSIELHTLYLHMENKITSKTKALESQFFTDSLTRLNNRYSLFSQTKKLKDFHVAILDVSGFKNINDVYGMKIGNKVLQELSKKYTYYLLDTGLTLFRLSGDEMVILNPNKISAKAFISTIETIINKIEHETFYFDKNTIEINISIHAGISFDTIHPLEKANIALTKAKQEHLDYLVFDKRA